MYIKVRLKDLLIILFCTPSKIKISKIKVKKIIDSTLQHIDMVASVFNDSSEISIFNAKDTLMNPSEDFINLLLKVKK